MLSRLSCFSVLVAEGHPGSAPERRTFIAIQRGGEPYNIVGSLIDNIREPLHEL